MSAGQRSTASHGRASWWRTVAPTAAAAIITTMLIHSGVATASSVDALEPTQVRLVTIHPHDVGAFTEGLFFYENSLVESTGLNERSFIRQYALEQTSRISTEAEDGSGDDDSSLTNKEFRFDPSMFGEGIATIGDKLYALTYKAKVILELSMRDFTLLSTYPIETSTGEGWGMTTDGELLIVSDGSSKIQFYDPSDSKFTLVRSIDVQQRDGKLIGSVNELEFIPGENEILANVWFQNHILRVNATDGTVLEVLDLTWLRNMVSNLQTPAMLGSRWHHDAVMNGIALDPQSKHVYVTGKLWDSIFELEFSYLSRNKKRHAEDHQPHF